MGYITKFGTIWGQVPVTNGRLFFVGGSSYLIEGRTYSGSDNADGLSPERAFATTNYAISQCTANAGDVVVLLPGYTETISAAGGWTCSIAGVRIVGLGKGASRPLITFSATTSTILVSAASVSIENIVVTPSVNAVVTAFDVRAADCTIGVPDGKVEVRDASSSVEFVRALLTTSAADRLRVDMRYEGQTGGSACVNAIRLVGSDSVRIAMDFYGKASTAVVEFLTTACTNVTVTGFVYNQSGAGSKTVVDTVTGSTWYASVVQGESSSTFAGGSNLAFAVGDLVALNSALGIPSADVTTNTRERDVIGNKTDASVYVPGTTKSIMAMAKGTADLQERVAVTTAAVMVSGNTIFTVTGGPIVIQALVSECVTTNDGTASTLQYTTTPTSGSAQTISAASSSLAAAAAGATVTLAGTALATAALLNANGANLIANPGTILVMAGTIKITIAVGSTTGTWRHYIRYKPLAVGVTVA